LQVSALVPVFCRQVIPHRRIAIEFFHPGKVSVDALQVTRSKRQFDDIRVRILVVGVGLCRAFEQPSGLIPVPLIQLLFSL
jgi:hypothetical protein